MQSCSDGPAAILLAAAVGPRGEVAERVQLDDRRQGSVVIGVVAVDPPPEFVERSDEVSGVLAAEGC